MPDSVEQIRKCTDTVGQIKPGGGSVGFPALLVPLRPIDVGRKPHARAFYEAEAIRGGWSVRQLDRQIGTQFFERTSHSKQQAAMLARDKGPGPRTPSQCKMRCATRTCWNSST